MLAKLKDWVQPVLQSAILQFLMCCAMAIASRYFLLPWPDALPSDEPGRNRAWLTISMFLIVAAGAPIYYAKSDRRWMYTLVACGFGGVIVWLFGFWLHYQLGVAFREATEQITMNRIAKIGVPVSLGIIDAGTTLGVFLVCSFFWRILRGDELVDMGHRMLPGIIEKSLQDKE